MMDWPPDYTLRQSKRAKRPSIRINHHQRIEVVIPEKMRFFDPLTMLNEHKKWILYQLAKNPVSVPKIAASFPTSINFPAFDLEYQVAYAPNDSQRLSCKSKESTLIFSGNITDWPKVQTRLIQWLNKKAALLLLPHLVLLTEQHGFNASSLQIRSMKTRWGVCRKNNKITLNSHLLFLPLSLIHHVILHELCHTRYMSHGPRFWNLLNKVDPLSQVHDKALKAVQQYLPDWL